MHKTAALALALTLAGSAFADRVSLLPTADAGVYQYAPTTNYGTNTRMEVGCWWTGLPPSRYEYRSFVQFDLGAIPAGSEIDACTLYVDGYFYASPAGDYTASRVTASWIESGLGGITWNNQPGIDNTNEVTINISGQGWRKFDVTAISREWMTGTSNYGLRLWKNSLVDSVARTYFATKENGTPANRESLWVTYTPPGASHITNIGRSPLYPMSTEEIGVSAKIWMGAGAIDSAKVSFSSDRTNWTFAQSDSNRAGDSMYFFHIPPRAEGDSCHYRIHTWSGAVLTTSSVNSLKIPRNVTVYTVQRCDTMASGASPWFDSLVHVTGIVSGVLNTNRIYFGPASGDTWGGLLIYRAAGGDPVLPGDSLDVVGKINEYNNLTEVDPLLRTDNGGTGRAFDTTTVTVAQARQEAFEGVLVRADSVRVLDSTGVGRVFNSARTYLVANASGVDSITLYVQSGSAFVGTPIPPGFFDLVSNCGQYALAHQFTPRYSEDVIRIADIQASVLLSPPTQMSIGDTTTPALVVRNLSPTDTAKGVGVLLNIGAGYSALRTSDLAPDQTDTVVFNLWTAVAGAHAVTASAAYVGDHNPTNDTLKQTCTVEGGDAQALAILAPTGTLNAGDMVTPTLVVRNASATYTATDVLATLTIGGVYSAAHNIAKMLPGQTDTLFLNPWMAIGGTFAVVGAVTTQADPNPGNDTARGSVVVTGSTTGRWQVRPTLMPDGPSGKQLKDGGWLVRDGDRIFAAKANKTTDFYSYTPANDSWRQLADWPRGIEAKPPTKGSAAVLGDAGIYATKGNNTQGFWLYDVGQDSWFQKANVPLGVTNKKVKGGTNLVYVKAGRGQDDTNYVYLLKGYKNELWRYNTATDSWRAMPDAPIGVNMKWDKGSWMVAQKEPGQPPKPYTFFAHKAKYHELWKFTTNGDTWFTIPLKPMPRTSLITGKTRKAADGSSADLLNDHIYALKGANTQEFYEYFTDGDSWRELDTIPAMGIIGKKERVKAGADIVAVGDLLYATKGNKCGEIWQYTPFAPTPLASRPDNQGVMAGPSALGEARLVIGPNPVANGRATISYGLPRAGIATISVYDALGRCVLVRSIGIRSSSFVLPRLGAGVYLVKLTAPDFSTTRKLVVQR